MFEDSDLLQRDMIVLRATAPPDAQFSVLDDRGREIGRVVAEGELVAKNVPTRLVLYDHRHMPVLALERSVHSDLSGAFPAHIPEYSVVDGRGQPVETGWRVLTMKPERPRRRRAGGGFLIRDSTKADVGSYAQALPPEGDYRLGATFLFTITAEVTSELRLAALGFAINFTESSSRFPAWMLKRLPKIGGLAWPGSAAEALTR